MRVLLVEDDQLLGEGLQTALAHFSYTVDWLREGRHVVSALEEQEFSLVILDLGLPDIDGITVLKTMRQRDIKVPVLILTARDQIEDKLVGLNSGADDYLVKPFDVRELEARLRTLTRRQQGNATSTITIGKARLDTGSHVLEFGGKSIEFSRREFPLLQAFFENPSKIFTREQLEALSYGWEGEVESNALEVHIHKLRKKLGNRAIKTVRGVGYMLIKDYFEGDKH